MQRVTGRTRGTAGPIAAVKSGVVASGGTFVAACVAAVMIVVWEREASAVTWDEMQLALGLLALCSVPSLTLCLLTRRDGRFPFLDVGVMCVMVTTLYFVMPLVNFMAGGMAFTVLSDNRLFVYNPLPRDIVPLIWGAVLYLVAFCSVYVMLRGEGCPLDVAIAKPSRARIAVVTLLLAGLGLFILAIEVMYRVSLAPSYADLRAGVGLVTQLPYYLQQLVHNLQGMFLIAKQALLIVVFFYWRRVPIRVFGIAWLLAEIMWAVARQGARTEAVLLILSAALLYHRLVRPLSFSRVSLGGCVLLAAVLVAGFVRDIGFEVGEMPVTPLADVSFLSVTNEFQSLFGTAFDLHEKSARGHLTTIPWTLYVSEILQLIPSQVLPFQKIGPAEWYLELIGLKDSQVGFMFGVLSQGVIGWGWAELFGRGMLLAGVYAAFHRWYVRRAASSSATLVYVFICVWSYYTVRATTFYFIYFLLYRLVPFVVAVMIGERILSAAVARPGKNR